jgi:hypothetical protein
MLWFPHPLKIFVREPIPAHPRSPRREHRQAADRFGRSEGETILSVRHAIVVIRSRKIGSAPVCARLRDRLPLNSYPASVANPGAVTSVSRRANVSSMSLRVLFE